MANGVEQQQQHQQKQKPIISNEFAHFVHIKCEFFVNCAWFSAVADGGGPKDTKSDRECTHLMPTVCVSGCRTGF